MIDNMRIWSRVEKTSRDYTNPFKKAGGFGGTSIDPMYQIKRATEVFGPIGDGWGVDVVEENIVDMPEGQKLHYVKIELWYYNEDAKRCHYHSFGQTMMVTQSRNGLRIIEEAPKMSLTDALTKALSWLGFSADVWLGAFDGVGAQKQHKEPIKVPPPREQQIKKLTELIKTTKIDLDKFLTYYKVSDTDDMTEEQLAHATKTLEARK